MTLRLLFRLVAELQDFALRMGDVLRTLSMIEQRSEVAIFADLTTISADVIEYGRVSRRVRTAQFRSSKV